MELVDILTSRPNLQDINELIINAKIQIEQNWHGLLFYKPNKNNIENIHKYQKIIDHCKYIIKNHLYYY
jgi:hypothetical protein